ncbi:MAG: hypothetical protein JKY45_06320 [Emcibacter sp.]|nr:hypothetical protein [Emcibacter sp.]
MTDSTIYNVSEEFAKNSHMDNERYLELYEQSVKDPEGFWGEMGKRID